MCISPFGCYKIKMTSAVCAPVILCDHIIKTLTYAKLAGRLGEDGPAKLQMVNHALGWRFEKVINSGADSETTRYLYSGFKVIEEQDNAGTKFQIQAIL